MIVGLSLMIVVPSFIVQSMWNDFYASHMERDLTIAWWQASLLWGAFLTLLYITGIFKFKIDIKELDAIDLDQITDPELRSELEEALKQQKFKESKIHKQTVQQQEKQNLDQDTTE